MKHLVRLDELVVVNKAGNAILTPWDGFRAILVMSVIAYVMLSL